MCGIYGVIRYKDSVLERNRVIPTRNLLKNLSILSTVRGRDAAGICVVTDDEIGMFKHHENGKKIVDSKGFNSVLTKINDGDLFRCAIGHTRAMTQGTEQDNRNNHPIICGQTIGVHNGIVYNDDVVFKTLKDEGVRRIAEVDSEAIFALINHYVKGGYTLKEAVYKASWALEGSFACAVVNANNTNELVLFRHGSPLCVVDIPIHHIAVFASTESIAMSAIRLTDGFDIFNSEYATTLNDNSGVRVDLKNKDIQKFKIKETSNNSRYNRKDHDYNAYDGAHARRQHFTGVSRNYECPVVTHCESNCSSCGTNLGGKVH